MTETERLRVLIVTPSLPYPLIWGFGIRVYQIIKYLAERHHVSVLAYAGPDDQARIAALRETGAAIYPVIRNEPSTRAKRRAQITSLLSPASFQKQSLDSAGMQAAIDHLLSTQKFDIIQVESSQMSAFNFRSAAPVLVDEHNIEYELLYRTFQTERSPVRKVYNWVEFQKFRREEMRSWQQAAGCILTSEREEDILRGHVPQVPTLVVPNGVDVDNFSPMPVAPDAESIVFLGVMHYRPNVDAALYFAREILPHILQVRPNAKFTIVGGGPPEELRRLVGPNIEVTGRVADTRPYVSRAGAFVVPLRMGSGTRLKVLEGLAMGRPLVSTSLGCEGIAAVDGEHLLIADEPRHFAWSVLRLLDDTELAARLGRRGRTLVEDCYSWPSVLGRLETFMHERRRNVPAYSVAS
ncbi:MAG: glycosyltransferase [Chloroflexi bacterium]|nr:glycosyltransferase [Chloroflexota bacterium]